LELLKLGSEIRRSFKQPVLSTCLIRKPKAYHLSLLFLSPPMAQAMLGIASRLWIASILSNAQHGNVLRLHTIWGLDLRSRQNRDQEKEDAIPQIVTFHKQAITD
jgi:hypothetical protein